MKAEAVAERHAGARPGWVLATYAEVGLPFYRVRARLQVLGRANVSAVEQFVVRAVDLGVNQVDDVSAALGLGTMVTEAAVAGLIMTDRVRLRHGSSDGAGLQLTQEGRDIVRDVERFAAREWVLDVDFDGLLRRPVVPKEALLEPRELRERGFREIPPHPTQPPGQEEFQERLTELAELIQELGDPAQQVADVVAVKSVERKHRVFLPAVALVFRAEGGRRVQVAFAVDGELTPSHEQAFARAGLAKRFGIPDRGLESAAKAAARVLGRDVFQEAAGDDPREARGERGVVRSAEAAEVPEASAEASLGPVRFLETYEHPRLLEQALLTAKARILLISPWLRRQVMDHDWFEKLEGALTRGVRVHLGWGIGKAAKGAEPDADADVLERLAELGKEFEALVVKRLGGTHMKILICDSQFVVITSFNWLSFKGDPKRTFRDERGTMVEIREVVDVQFAELLKRFEARPARL